MDRFTHQHLFTWLESYAHFYEVEDYHREIVNFLNQNPELLEPSVAFPAGRSWPEIVVLMNLQQG